MEKLKNFIKIAAGLLRTVVMFCAVIPWIGFSFYAGNKAAMEASILVFMSASIN